MSTAQIDASTRKPLRLWPGVVAAAILCFAKFILPLLSPDNVLYSILGTVGAGVVIILWWAFFSRAPMLERWGAILLAIVAALITSRFIDKSIADGLMGKMFLFFSFPVFGLALFVGAAVGQLFHRGGRRATMVAAILLASVGWTMVRTGGISGGGVSDLAWRWTPTPEERLLAQQANDKPIAIQSATVSAKVPVEPVVTRTGSESISREPTPTATASGTTPGPKAASKPEVKTEMKPAEWPGFRGPHRDGIVPGGVRIETDWTASPPVQMWRRAVGPGWSSFAVRGDLFYTQEQRGDNEVVSCYRLSTGEPVWRHGDPARFWESNGGAGPRATPTLSDGRVYAFGATGILNALDDRTGAVVWSRNVATDAEKKVPGWGFASSPLVIDDLVIVAAGGRLAAYDLATGKLRWLGPKGGDGYSSPQRVKIDGVEQVLLLSGHGAVSVAPADGKQIWEYPWVTDTRIVQPGLASDSDILVATGEAMGGSGMRRIAIANGPGGWTAQERWTSNGLKPNFSDFVVHDGHAYGFDGSILSCIDLKDGKRVWKGGRYGAGQLVLLQDQNLLVVTSEEGALALVSATTDQFKELAHFPAIEGKTWNHPAVAGNVLLVRNGEEMVGFKLALARN